MESSRKEIVRLARTTLDGTKPATAALQHIRGVGPSLAQAILRTAGVDPSVRMGELSDEQIKKVEEVLLNPGEHGVPWWMLNRQRDRETGDSSHQMGDDIKLAVERDVKAMRTMKTWKGVRHRLGLKVRGQRTRTTGRVGRTLGYKRKGARRG